jgi:hypothetical protein
MAFESFRPRALRLYLLLLAVYLLPLLAVVPVFHLERFDWGAAITYAFFAIVVGMGLSALWHLLRGTAVDLEGPAAAAPSSEPPSGATKVWLTCIAVVMGIWGLGLFALPDGPLSWVWLWPQDALTSRLIAVMLLTLAAGAALGRADNQSGAMMLAMAGTYGIGGAAAGLRNASAGKPIPLAYVVAFAPVALVSLTLLARDISRR